MNGGRYLIAHAHLKHRPILLRPFPSNSSMLIPQLQQIPEQRQTRNLRQVLDFGDIGAIQIANNKIHNGNDRDPDRCGRHFVATTIPSSDRKCCEKNSTSIAEAARFISAIIVLRRDYSVASKEQDDYRHDSVLWVSSGYPMYEGGISGGLFRGAEGNAAMVGGVN